jgi:photosystem II stability/assembly factor-like uncharacterized protein
MTFRPFLPRFAVLFALLLPAALWGSSIGNVWEWQNPSPQGNPLYRVAYGNGVYVAVGEAGMILSTEEAEPPENDGTDPGDPDEEEFHWPIDWVVRQSDTRQWLSGVIFADDQFVAVGNRGTILTSPDGIDWSCQYSGTLEWLWDVAYLDEHYWAVGSGGIILSSPDAIHWTEHPQPEPRFLRSIAYDGSLYAAVGNTGTILTSEDGLLWDKVEVEEWEEIPPNFHPWLYSVTYAFGRFIAVGEWGIILTSSDGVLWEELDYVFTSQNLSQVLHDDTLAYIVGHDGTLLLSTDGLIWQPVPTGIYYTLRGLALGDEELVVVGSGGKIAHSPSDEFDWREFDDGYKNTFFAAAYAGETFIVVGDQGRLLRSVGELGEDDFEWSSEWSGTSNWLQDVVFGGGIANENPELNGRFVAVGRNGTIRYSDDTEMWTIAGPDGPGHLDSVTFGNDTFVAVGQYGKIQVSSDGVTWENKAPEYEPETEPARYLRGVTFGDDLFVAVGDRGRIMISPDGADWEIQESPVTTPLRAVAYGDEKYIAVGGIGLILSSTDGEHWIVEDSRTFVNLQNILFHDGIWLIVGDWGTILASYDGENWFEHKSGTNFQLYGITHTEDSFMIVGQGGTILTSTETTTGLDYWTWVAQNGMSGPTGRPDANPSGDGLPNLLKFYMGLDPNLSERHMAPAIEYDVGDPGAWKPRLVLTFQRAMNIVGVEGSLEASSNLVDWMTSAYKEKTLEEIEEDVLHLVSWTEEYVVNLTRRRFLRLRVSETNFECVPPQSSTAGSPSP